MHPTIKEATRQTIEFFIGFYMAKIIVTYIEPKIVASSQEEQQNQQQQINGVDQQNQPIQQEQVQPEPKPKPKKGELMKILTALILVFGTLIATLFIRSQLNKMFVLRTAPTGFVLGFMIYLQSNEIILNSFSGI